MAYRKNGGDSASDYALGGFYFGRAERGNLKEIIKAGATFYVANRRRFPAVLTYTAESDVLLNLNKEEYVMVKELDEPLYIDYDFILNLEEELEFFKDNIESNSSIREAIRNSEMPAYRTRKALSLLQEVMTINHLFYTKEQMKMEIIKIAEELD